MADKRRGKDFREAAESFMKRFDKGGKRACARAVAIWEEVAGPQVAAHTRAVAVREGELLVHVDSNAWATELSAMAPRFIEALNGEAGQVLVRAIRFTVTRTVEQERRREDAEREHDAWTERDKVEPEPLDEAGKQAVERSVSAIEDPGLREMARRAMTADLEWKRAARRPRKDRGEGGEKAARTG